MPAAFGRSLEPVREWPLQKDHGQKSNLKTLEFYHKIFMKNKLSFSRGGGRLAGMQSAAQNSGALQSCLIAKNLIDNYFLLSEAELSTRLQRK